MNESDIFERQVDRAKALLLIWLICPLLSFALIYMVGSFTAGTTNPADWSEESRGLAILPWLIFTIAGLITCTYILDEWAGADRRAKYWEDLYGKACEVNSKL